MRRVIDGTARGPEAARFSNATASTAGGHERMHAESMNGPSRQPQQQVSKPAPGELERLYEESFPFVWRSVRRLGVPTELAEDAAQDVFLVAARRWAEFEHRSAARTWLFSISMHVAKYYRRTEYRHRRRIDALRLREERPCQPHTKTEAQQTLLRLMDSLDDQRRAVYVLAELEGMTAPEIAEAVGINVNTVYTRLRAARKTVLEAARRASAPEEIRQSNDAALQPA